MFLDHDLADEHYGGHDSTGHEKSGSTLTLDIMRGIWNARMKQVIIHSWNPQGAMLMAKHLERHWNTNVMPFMSFNIEMVGYDVKQYGTKE